MVDGMWSEHRVLRSLSFVAGSELRSRRHIRYLRHRSLSAVRCGQQLPFLAWPGGQKPCPSAWSSGDLGSRLGPFSSAAQPTSRAAARMAKMTRAMGPLQIARDCASVLHREKQIVMVAPTWSPSVESSAAARFSEAEPAPRAAAPTRSGTAASAEPVVVPGACRRSVRRCPVRAGSGAESG